MLFEKSDKSIVPLKSINEKEEDTEQNTQTPALDIAVTNVHLHRFQFGDSALAETTTTESEGENLVSCVSRTQSFKWKRAPSTLHLNTDADISFLQSDGTIYTLRSSRSKTKRSFSPINIDDDCDDDDAEDDLDESCIEKCFAPTSVKGAVFNLVTAIVGSGILSFPYAFRASGLLWGAFLLTMCTCFAYISLNLLIIASANMPEEAMDVVPTYLSLAFTTGGKKLMIFTQIIIIIQLFGSAISRYCVSDIYIIMYSTTLAHIFRIVAAGEILARLFVSNPFFIPVHDENQQVYSKYFVIGFCALFVFPLGLMKNMSSFRFTSLLSVCCSSLLTIILFVEYFILCHEAPQSACFWKPDAFGAAFSGANVDRLGSFNLSGFLTSIPIFVFGYNCHANVFPIYAELGGDNHSKESLAIGTNKVKEVFKISLVVSHFFYTIAGAMAFMTFFGGTCGNILLNDFGNAPQVTIASLLFAVSLVCVCFLCILISQFRNIYKQILAAPVFVNAIRGNINQMFWKDTKKIGLVTHVFMTFFIVLTGVMISILVDDVSEIFGFLGCTANPIGGYILPTFFVWKLVGKEQTKYKSLKWLSLVMSVVISLLSMGSLAFKIWTYITGHSLICDATV